jgi:hypothetical protein
MVEAALVEETADQLLELLVVMEVAAEPVEQVEQETMKEPVEQVDKVELGETLEQVEQVVNPLAELAVKAGAEEMETSLALSTTASTQGHT